MTYYHKPMASDSHAALISEIADLRKQVAELQHENEEQKTLLQSKYGDIHELPEYKKAKRYAENKSREVAELRKQLASLQHEKEQLTKERDGALRHGDRLRQKYCRGTSAGENDENLRNAVLEEAADIADQHTTIEGIGQKIAYKIRLLKSKPTNKE